MTQVRSYTTAELAAEINAAKGLNLTETEVARAIELQATGRELTTARRADGTDVVAEIFEPGD